MASLVQRAVCFNQSSSIAQQQHHTSKEQALSLQDSAMGELSDTKVQLIVMTYVIFNLIVFYFLVTPKRKSVWLLIFGAIGFCGCALVLLLMVLPIYALFRLGLIDEFVNESTSLAASLVSGLIDEFVDGKISLAAVLGVLVCSSAMTTGGFWVTRFVTRSLVGLLVQEDLDRGDAVPLALLTAINALQVQFAQFGDYLDRINNNNGMLETEVDDGHNVNDESLNDEEGSDEDDNDEGHLEQRTVVNIHGNHGGEREGFSDNSQNNAHEHQDQPTVHRTLGNIACNYPSGTAGAHDCESGRTLGPTTVIDRQPEPSVKNASFDPLTGTCTGKRGNQSEEEESATRMSKKQKNDADHDDEPMEYLRVKVAPAATGTNKENHYAAPMEVDLNIPKHDDNEENQQSGLVTATLVHPTVQEDTNITSVIHHVVQRQQKQQQHQRSEEQQQQHQHQNEYWYKQIKKHEQHQQERRCRLGQVQHLQQCAAVSAKRTDDGFLGNSKHAEAAPVAAEDDRTPMPDATNGKNNDKQAALTVDCSHASFVNDCDMHEDHSVDKGIVRRENEEAKKPAAKDSGHSTLNETTHLKPAPGASTATTSPPSAKPAEKATPTALAAPAQAQAAGLLHDQIATLKKDEEHLEHPSVNDQDEDEDDDEGHQEREHLRRQSPRLHSGSVRHTVVTERNVVTRTFSSVWGKLKRRGWTHHKGGLLENYFYCKPGITPHSFNAQAKVNCFNREELMDYYARTRRSRNSRSRNHP